MHGCEGCNLGFQPNINGCCVMRGNHSSKLMIVGEGPGKEEDSKRSPFTGPAGRLLDKIWQSVQMSTDGWYLTNAVLCRPVAPQQVKKQNLTPKVKQLQKCRPFLRKQIYLLNPKVIVPLGKIATEAVLNSKIPRMGDYRGKLLHVGERLVFPMYHPAAILHASRDPEREYELKLATWKDVQRLKSILEEKNLV